MDAELSALHQALSAQRRHVTGILDGLDDDQLSRPVLSSGWTAAGLVHHLAVDVERFWFRAVMAGQQQAWDSFTDDDTWQLAPGTAASSVLTLYGSEIELADAVITAAGADTEPARWPTELFGSFRLHTLRAVLLHVITETACHAGHLDAARELLDGRQWMVV